MKLVRLEVLTPTHLGSAAGEAALDRPTEREAFWSLPFVPDSALKGNLAAPWGDVADHDANEPRESRFGSPDRRGEPGEPDRPGRPSPFSIGNAELVAFPMSARDGGVAWVVPALGIARLLELDGAAPDAATAAAAGLAEIEPSGHPGRPGRFAAWPVRPALDALTGLEPVDEQTTADLAAALGPLLGRYLGVGQASGPILVVSAATAGRLFRRASELRTLTALGPGKVVAPGALRRVELVPPGTIFVATLSGQAPQLPARLQVGAWESLGCGWLAVDPVKDRNGVPAGAGEEAPLLDPASEMAEMHQAIERLAREAPELSAKASAAIGRFGPRAAFSGFAATLAFAAAKARPSDPKPSLEARAHRWLFATLLDLEGDVPVAEGTSAPLLAWLASSPFSAASLASVRDRTLLRWHWLRRSAELGLGGFEEARLA